ncbi:MAG: biotin/lipoyl-binding protein [Theionarchaea archaeon]|nr:biotin/lipoyl-binding protein [Theionarchaea archaeon]
MKYTIEINGNLHEVEVEEQGSGYLVRVDGVAYEARIRNVGGAAKTEVIPATPSVPAAPSVPSKLSAPSQKTPGAVVAPMPGMVLKLHVAAGDTVAIGTLLLTLEAMKMENEIASHVSGIVKGIYVKEGQSVNTGDTILVIT